jgi:hypothetical protein
MRSPPSLTKRRTSAQREIEGGRDALACLVAAGTAAMVAAGRERTDGVRGEAHVPHGRIVMCTGFQLWVQSKILMLRSNVVKQYIRNTLTIVLLCLCVHPNTSGLPSCVHCTVCLLHQRPALAPGAGIRKPPLLPPLLIRVPRLRCSLLAVAARPTTTRALRWPPNCGRRFRRPRTLSRRVGASGPPASGPSPLQVEP